MESVRYEYDVDGENFASAGRASESVKRTLKQLGVSPESVRRVAIAMYEGEINMVIHAHGGKAVVDLFPDHVEIRLIDRGPGIADIELAMKAGYSTAPESIRSLGFGAGMGLPNMKKYSDEMTISGTFTVESGSGTLILEGDDASQEFPITSEEPVVVEGLTLPVIERDDETWVNLRVIADPQIDGFSGEYTFQHD